MNVQDHNDETSLSGLEDHARALLAESVTRIDGRVRSRLNQARQAAVAEAAGARRKSMFSRRLFLVPTAGAAAAAALVAMVLLQQHRPLSVFPVGEGQVTAEDLDLIADGDGLELVQDSDNSFYEWAAAQSDSGGGETTT